MTLSRQDRSELLARATVSVLFTLLTINILQDFLRHGPRHRPAAARERRRS